MLGKRGLISDVFGIILIGMIIVLSAIFFPVASLIGGTTEATISGTMAASADSTILSFLRKNANDKTVYESIISYCDEGRNEQEIIMASRDIIWGSVISLEFECNEDGKKLVIRPYLCDVYSLNALVDITTGPIAERIGTGPSTIEFGDASNGFKMKYCAGKGFLRTADGKIWIGGIVKDRWKHIEGWIDKGDLAVSETDPAHYYNSARQPSIYGIYVKASDAEVLTAYEFITKYKGWDFKQQSTLEAFKNE